MMLKKPNLNPLKSINFYLLAIIFVVYLLTIVFSNYPGVIFFLQGIVYICLSFILLKGYKLTSMFILSLIILNNLANIFSHSPVVISILAFIFLLGTGYVLYRRNKYSKPKKEKKTKKKKSKVRRIVIVSSYTLVVLLLSYNYYFLKLNLKYVDFLTHHVEVVYKNPNVCKLYQEDTEALSNFYFEANEDIKGDVKRMLRRDDAPQFIELVISEYESYKGGASQQLNNMTKYICGFVSKDN